MLPFLLFTDKRGNSVPKRRLYVQNEHEKFDLIEDETKINAHVARRLDILLVEALDDHK